MIKLFACIFLIVAGAASSAAQSGSAETPAHVPTVTATLEGNRTEVFSTPRQSCDANDVPDSMARAFRDYTGMVHFLTASTDLYQFLGTDLNHLTRSCDAAFKSTGDANPANYNDQAWLSSFYTLDGKKIAALTHTEYHGWAHTGECNIADGYNACEYDSDTYHVSKDGGYHFDSFKTPKNFLAGIPYKYMVDDGPASYSVDTNVVKLGDWYYAVASATAWPPNCSGTTGANRCLVQGGGGPLRTQDVFDPASWRAWNGKEFAVSFADPYAGPIAHPEDHVLAPVPYMGFITGLNVSQCGDFVIGTLWDYWDNELGPPGFYFTTSRDLVHWTKPQLVAALAEIQKGEPKGSWLYAYFSLIDPDAPDPNFSVVGDHPYLYYIRLDNNGQDRVLFRQKLHLTVHP